MIELPFASQEGKSSVLQNSRETLLNMYAEVETSGRRRLTRKQRAGLDQVYAQTGEKRCIEEFSTYTYAVIDSTFYKFDGTTLTSLGTLGTSSGRCTMIEDDNGKILISDGASGYYWNGTVLTVVAFSTQVGHVTFQSGFGIYPKPGTGTFYITGLNALNTQDPLDFATAESNPDPIVRAFVDHNELWLFGSKTIEIWQETGSADFPFQPLTNSKIERGCAAAFSVAQVDNTLFFLGDDLIVYRADGYRPQRISTHTIERKIAEIPAAARALADAYTYTIAGHKFYTLRFPGYATLQFNVATGLWNHCETFGYPDWRILGSAGRSGTYLMTDAGICVLDDTLNTDEDGIMRRQAISAPIWADGKRVTLRAFFLDLEVGRAAIDVTDPQIMLRVAPDGETFGNERWRSLGNTGNYKQRVIWRGLGIGRRLTIEVTCTDNVALKILGGDGAIFVGST